MERDFERVAVPIDLRNARAQLRAATRDVILVTAARLLSTEGPASLTVRRVAQDVGASTKVIYTAFGGKDGLLDALFVRSFTGLADALSSQAGVADRSARVRAMALAYRDYAIAEPGFYTVMYGDLGRSWEVPADSREKARSTFRILREAIEAALPARRRGEAVAITRLLWATMHGVISLYMRDLLADADDFDPLFRDAVDSVLKAHRICSELQ